MEGGNPSRDTPPAGGGDDLFTTPGPDQQSCRPPKDPCTCCKDCGASDSAGEDNPALDRPWNGCPRPVFVHYQSRDPFGPKTTHPGRSWELESGRWPVKLAPALCPWEPGNPESSGNPSHEEIDPFQVVDELTASGRPQSGSPCLVWRTCSSSCASRWRALEVFPRWAAVFLPGDLPPRPGFRAIMDEGDHQGAAGQGKEEGIFFSP